MTDTPIVELKNLSSYYGKGKKRLKYLKNILHDTDHPPCKSLYLPRL